jgi:hypothetical protein
MDSPLLPAPLFSINHPRKKKEHVSLSLFLFHHPEITSKKKPAKRAYKSKYQTPFMQDFSPPPFLYLPKTCAPPSDVRDPDSQNPIETKM